jgi:hypothetical protein
MNPVGGFEDVEVVLDDDHAVAAVDEGLEDAEQAFDVVAVQAGGGLVEQEQGAGWRFLIPGSIFGWSASEV